MVLCREVDLQTWHMKHSTHMFFEAPSTSEHIGRYGHSHSSRKGRAVLRGSEREGEPAVHHMTSGTP